jgi:hypothetical protein
MAPSIPVSPIEIELLLDMRSSRDLTKLRNVSGETLIGILKKGFKPSLSYVQNAPPRCSPAI